MPRVLKFRDLIRILKKHDPRFEVWSGRGKGSHRMLYHPDIGGRPESFPVVIHGANNDQKPNFVKDVIERFRLPKDLFD
ncbi:MAG: hypothetical protein KJ042_18640 [Deltaproteobacteria bacterium]|nr:hypothetical protein [Deltaproteobacteria bacterium]